MTFAIIYSNIFIVKILISYRINNEILSYFFFLKVTDEVSINATINAMSLLSTLGESTNIAIPLLVLQSPRVCYQVMILGGRFI